METENWQKSLYVSLVLFLVSFCVVIFESCSQKLSQSQSPTAPVASEESKGNPKQKKDVVEGVKPMIQYFSEGYIYNGGTEWFLVNYAPASGLHTMLDVSTATPDQLSTFYHYYGFRIASCTDQNRSEYTSAGFNQDSLLIYLGSGDSGGLIANWQTAVNDCGSSVLGYWIDEPSNVISASTMYQVQTLVLGYGKPLWLDDYDTGVIPEWEYPCYSYHLADWGTLHYANYLMCDADNAKNTNGVGDCGTYLAENYNEFLNYDPGLNIFNTVFTMPAYPSEGDVIAWLENHVPQVNNFALWLPSSWSWGDIDNFVGWAYQAGFLGQYQLLKQAQYVCEANNVGFSPGSSGIAGSYYGVWNGSYYTGPVDPNTQGATLCWMLQTWVSQNQYQTVFAR